MIKEIKDYFEDLAKKSIDKNIEVFRSLQDDERYNYPYYVSILIKDDVLKKEFINDKYENNKLTKKKYTREIVFNIALCGSVEDEVDNWVTNFLKKLDSYITVNDEAVEIIPSDIKYSDSDSLIRDVYLAVIRIKCVTGIYTEQEVLKIKDIKLEKIKFNK